MPSFQHFFETRSLNRRLARPRLLGATYSELQCEYLEIDFRETFLAVQSLGLDVIRLSTYWSQIERERGSFDFSTIDWLLERAGESNCQIVLCVGIKTPRWPEFHFPTWIADKYDINRTDVPLDQIPGLAEEALSFTRTLVEHLRLYPRISYWQIENEALNRTPYMVGRFLSSQFVMNEIKLVKQLVGPDQNILFTLNVEPPLALQRADRMLRPLLPLVDAVGFDVYTKIGTPFRFPSYIEPLPPFWWNLRLWKDLVSSNHKEAWITESQAEPWEWKRLVSVGVPFYPSSDPIRALQLASRLTELGFDRVIFWGCEYWYRQKKDGWDGWWNDLKNYVNQDRVRSIYQKDDP